MKRIYLLAASAVALGYANGAGRTETMLVKGADGKPLRINADDYDSKQHTKWSGKDPAENAATGNASDVNVTGNGVDGEVLTTAAPSAPDFSNPSDAAPLPIDESKNAAAPAITTADQLLVMKTGSGKSAKFFISDGLGQKITGDKAKLLGIDENGYDSEAAAKEVQSRTEPKRAAAL